MTQARVSVSHLEVVVQNRRLRQGELPPEEDSFECRFALDSFDMGEIALVVGLDGSEALIVYRPLQLLPVLEDRSVP
jgi:hypothetical protein